MKKGVLIAVGISVLVLGMFLGLRGLSIQNPEPEECDIKDFTVTDITGTAGYDIVFHNAEGDFYYINRGLEQDYTVEGLKKKVLNKKVTLHLPRIMYGKFESNHIAQLKLGDEIIFTEFKIKNKNSALNN